MVEGVGVELSLLDSKRGYATVESLPEDDALVNVDHPDRRKTYYSYTYILVLLAIVVVVTRPLWANSPKEKSSSLNLSDPSQGKSASPTEPLQETYKLAAPDAEWLAKFGMSIAVDGNTLVVGAPDAYVDGHQRLGKVYVYKREDQRYTLVQELPESSSLYPIRMNFGSAVAVRGDTIAVGIPWVDSNGKNQGVGKVEIYSKVSDGYAMTGFVTSEERNTKLHFGSSLAMTDDTLVVGVPFDGGSDRGSVYVYKRIERDHQSERNDDPDDETMMGWSQVQILTPNDATDQDRFGGQVAILEDSSTIVVGVPRDSDKGKHAGSVYVFEQESGSSEYAQTEQLYAKDGQSGDGFGSSVSITLDTLVVGANSKVRDLSGMTGSAYVFKHTAEGWEELQTLRARDSPKDSGMFGECVSISNNGRRIVVGDSEISSGNSGHAYVFELGGTTWKQSHKLTPSDPSKDHRFGRFVDVSGDTVVVSAMLDGFGRQSESGSVYVYEL